MNSSPGPIAGRLRRPRWSDPRLLIGIGLIAVSVLATASVVNRADRTEPFYAARHILTPGTVLDESDVVVAHVRVGVGKYVAASEAPWGKVVTRVVGAGEMVPAGALADAAAYSSRPVAVTTASQLAEGIEPGAVVDVWLTRDGLAGPESVLVAGALVVDQVDRDAGAFARGTGETVYVLVPTRDIGAFLTALAVDGEVTVVGLAGDSA